mmetsp:Transcript_58454/g.122103  ORF Transcript_58454/g.122103 Transcript_58454/m.122103 type:complete len:89 (-) Transcript_58454:288-554(-)
MDPACSGATSCSLPQQNQSLDRSCFENYVSRLVVQGSQTAGVRPMLFLQSKSTPLLTKSLIAGSRLFKAARCNGVFPCKVRGFLSTPF